MFAGQRVSPYMDADRIERIFLAALERPRGARESYVREACGDDERLKQRLRSLLAAHDEAGDFMSAACGRRLLQR